MRGGDVQTGGRLDEDFRAVVEQAADGIFIASADMPKMGGFELATKLAELQPGLRVLYSSGYTESSIVDQGVLAEGINFLQKPYSPSTLARRVREALSR
jgi:two-component system cell cycle sensor histidine kinase/response regulator CckA